MGLDGVELVMDIEDEFNISIPDEEAEKLRTINDLYEYVSRVYDREADTRKVVPCATQHAFYKLRKALMEMTNAERKSIRPDTDLKTYLTEQNKLLFWKELGDKTNCKLPDITLKPKVIISCLLIPIIILVSIFAVTCYYSTDIEFVKLCSMIGFITGVILCVFVLIKLSKIPTFLNDLPERCDRVRDVVKYTARNYISQNVPKDIWERIIRIVSRNSGVEEKELTPKTDFVRDLAF